MLTVARSWRDETVSVKTLVAAADADDANDRRRLYLRIALLLRAAGRLR
jgi:hypothetical protein